MYLATQSTPAPLATSRYTSPAAHDDDVAALRRGAWQLVATDSMLARPGDFVRVRRLGVSCLVRNHDGELVGVSNVCAHRQCELVDRDSGHCDELKCPYHGWCYGGDGRTRKIPAANNFPHFDRQQHRLPTYPVMRVGQLVFVHLGGGAATSPDANAIDDWRPWRDELADRSDERRWRLVMRDVLEYPCDWKVPIEGSLESYHLAEVHAATFGNAPAESASKHEIIDSGTAFETDAREPSFLANLEAAIVGATTGRFDPRYRHIHVFPNVMATLTETMTLVYQISPTAHGHCRMDVFGFVRRPERYGVLGRWLHHGIGIAAARLARSVLAEDAAIFSRVQAGMNASASAGDRRPRVFGRCEERLDAFGRFWARRTESHHHE